MFTETSTVEALLRDLLAGSQAAGLRETSQAFAGRQVGGLGWEHIPGRALLRRETDVLVEAHLRDALLRLNPEITAQPRYADDVLYRLRAILLTASTEGLVRANEEFTAWLRGDKSMPFGLGGEHVPVRLLDFDHPEANRCVVASQVTFRPPEKRFDLVLFVNGIPLVVGEAKTPSRPAVSWVDGAAQVHDDYEESVPVFFVPNVLSFATEGKTFRFGAIRMPLDLWAPWREERTQRSGLAEVQLAVRGLLRPAVLLDILQHFTLFATDKKRRRSKLLCRAQQYEAANQIVDRVVAGWPKKGLIWHFQGSGKSLLMVFAAQKLRRHPALRNPTVLIVIDRIDLDTQIGGTFTAVDVPNLEQATTREQLQTLLARDTRKVIITTIFKFAEAPGELNDRANIIVLVDEAHRTQEGDLGRRMREALPNAFFFGLTGTPINHRDRNTFWAFGAAEDPHGYMNRYGFEESVRDHATLPLHFEPRLTQLHVDRATIDIAFAALTDQWTEDDRDALARQVARMAVLVKTPERIRVVAADIARHFRERVQPQGFKGQVVAFDRAACVLYKQALDEMLPPEASAVVMTVGPGEAAWRQFDRSRDEEERLLDDFRDPADPLQLLIVTARLLTGFDAPILQAMYLDKPLKEHTLLQAICRVNRPYPNKTYGLVVDYIGVFDDVAQALAFDERIVQQVISNLDTLRAAVPDVVARCLAHFPAIDRQLGGYEGLIAAQECLATDERRDAFAADYGALARLWEALSPDPCLGPHEADYRWLSQVYESVRPPSGHGKLLWHALGAKTVELIHQHVHVEALRDDLETLVLDPGVLEELLANPDPTKVKRIEIDISGRLRRHGGNPVFVALGERLEELRRRHEEHLVSNLDFLKLLLQLARDVVQAEKQVDPVQEEDRGKTALTELFAEVRNANTPILTERIVADIDQIVRIVRFEGWQQTKAGERDVKKALRQTLLKYKLHTEQDLFDRAYGYIEQYY